MSSAGSLEGVARSWGCNVMTARRGGDAAVGFGVCVVDGGRSHIRANLARVSKEKGVVA
jgi:hypothetical protein